MASAADEGEAVGERSGGIRPTLEQVSLDEPELGAQPYLRLMTAIGGLGIIAACVAAAVGLSTDPALPFLDSVPTLPSGLPTLPTRLPDIVPTGEPQEPPPADLPTFPTDFPGLPRLPQVGGVS
ncbi:hypothetical protein [Streptomyces eurythermus]|uniref:hypothetical protein n=1 Tax=Streptomyces eurythermus TaxID=42237 RepID=UPI0033F97D7F